ncbi:MAG: hypothetical protein GXO75_20580 [Calditrichaeota bacterium]|nr:hypothetical protein [Calditrichota bacterium]
MKHLKYVFSVIFVLFFSATAFPVTFGSGAMHVNPAWSVPKGSLLLGGHSSAFFKDEVNPGTGGLSSAVTYWDVQGMMGLIYGFTDKVEFHFSQMMYQDTNYGDKAFNIPDDLWLNAKLGSIGPKNGSVRVGVQLDLRLPTGHIHNIPLEPYSAARIGVGVTGLFSIITEPLFPELGLNINANIGYFNHNDVGQVLTSFKNDKIAVEQNTTELVYGFSVSNMSKDFGYFGEIYGRYFIQKPPVTAFTRENSLFVTPGIMYTPNPWLRLKVGLDLRILGNKDETAYSGDEGSVLRKPWQTVPNLPSWRINVGAIISLRRNATKPAGQIPAFEGTSLSIADTTARDEKLLDQLAKERQQTESAEAELDQIRNERERMENLLKRLRNILQQPSGTAEQTDNKAKEENKKEDKKPE